MDPNIGGIYPQEQDNFFDVLNMMDNKCDFNKGKE